MTILFLARLFHPHIGGVETHVKEVAKRLVTKGHRVIVVTETHGRLEKDIDGIKVVHLAQGKDDWFKKFRIWWWFIMHSELIEKADIVHCHDVFFWVLPFRLLFPLKKIFTTFHGYEIVYPPSKKARLIRKISEKLSNGTIAVGDFIEKWYGTKATYVTYGGVNKIPSQRLVGLWPKKRKNKRILFLGRLEEDTGIPIYLRTLEKLKEQNVSFEFTACGDGSLASKVRKYGKVVGFVLDIPWYIMQADIVFASSYLSMLEAMVLKKPIIAVYTNPLKKDYLYMTPFHKWITIADNQTAIVNNIVNEKKSKDTKQRVFSAYAWAKRQTWDEVVKIYETLWKTQSKQ